MGSEFEKIDLCVNCSIREFCDQFPDDEYTCEDIKRMAVIADI